MVTTVTVDAATGEIIGDIDGDLPPERAVTVRPSAHIQSGLGAVALLDDDAFEANLAMIRKGVARARRMQEALLDEGTDYGKVANVKRPFLHKPGAEKLEKAYGLAARFEHQRFVGDGETGPALQVVTHAYIHLGDHGGPIVAEGAGEANTWEAKYRYRRGERVCPKCGQPAIIKGKDEYGGGWVCLGKKGGCGAKWPDGAAEIEAQAVGDVDNPDPWDLANTIVKMSTKRAYVDGILRATATSGLFTQDEDSPVVSRPQEREAHAGVSGRPAAGSSPAGGAATPKSHGPLVYRGSLRVRASGVSDGNVRQGPDGPYLIVAAAGDRPIAQVVFEGALALDVLDAAAGTLDGLACELTGELWEVPWEKAGKAMPPFARLVVSRIVTADWTLPLEGGAS